MSYIKNAFKALLLLIPIGITLIPVAFPALAGILLAVIFWVALALCLFLLWTVFDWPRWFNVVWKALAALLIVTLCLVIQLRLYNSSRATSASSPSLTPQSGFSAQLITPSPSPGPPEISFLNAGMSYNASYYAVEPTLFIKNQGGVIEIRSGVSQHIGNFLNSATLQLERIRKVFNDAKKNVSGNWYTIQGNTGYRIPLPAGYISPWQYGQLESQKAEYTWAVYIVAKNDQWVRHFFFCGINAGPGTTTAVCPDIDGANGDGP